MRLMPLWTFLTPRTSAQCELAHSDIHFLWPSLTFIRLKTHFKNSQFIIVSLKEGMFNNANVLFRTKFIDGVSAVQRTTPGVAGKAAGGGAAVGGR
jgi:hypothetical protein